MTEAERVIRRIYDEVRSFDKRIGERLGPARLGFEILYGPPVPTPPIMFIGYQPGGGHQSYNKTDEQTQTEPPWPKETEFGFEPPPYRLAERLQVAFEAKFLGRCTGLNAIFWRSPREDVYAATVSKDLRSEIEQFSMQCVRQIVRAIAPRSIVVMGNKAGEVVRRHSGYKESVVVRAPVNWMAEIDGIPAYGIPHPSASLTNSRLREVGQYVLAKAEARGPTDE